jgi:hypothetical protein
MQIRRVTAPLSQRDSYRYGGGCITAGFENCASAQLRFTYGREPEPAPADAGSAFSLVRAAIGTSFC